MTSKPKLTLFPAVPPSACGCGSSCEPRDQTSAAEAEALLHAIRTEFGDRVEVATAAYRTAPELDGAMRTLAAALSADGHTGWPLTRRNLLALLEAGGPFLVLDGRLVGHGVLPPLRLLGESVRRLIGESDPSSP